MRTNRPPRVSPPGQWVRVYVETRRRRMTTDLLPAHCILLLKGRIEALWSVADLEADGVPARRAAA